MRLSEVLLGSHKKDIFAFVLFIAEIGTSAKNTAEQAEKAMQVLCKRI